MSTIQLLYWIKMPQWEMQRTLLYTFPGSIVSRELWWPLTFEQQRQARLRAPRRGLRCGVTSDLWYL